MNCPKCKKNSVCFCSNCKSRRKYPRQRAEIAHKGEFLKCPYCREILSFDFLEDQEYKEIKK